MWLPPAVFLRTRSAAIPRCQNRPKHTHIHIPVPTFHFFCLSFPLRGFHRLCVFCRVNTRRSIDSSRVDLFRHRPAQQLHWPDQPAGLYGCLAFEISFSLCRYCSYLVSGRVFSFACCHMRAVVVGASAPLQCVYVLFNHFSHTWLRYNPPCCETFCCENVHPHLAQLLDWLLPVSRSEVSYHLGCLREPW